MVIPLLANQDLTPMLCEGGDREYDKRNIFLTNYKECSLDRNFPIVIWQVLLASTTCFAKFY